MAAQAGTIAAGPAPLRPFLKWAGNKYRVLDHIRRHLPSGRRLVEPFAGSGALFLNSHFPAYLLTDSNPDLINLYTILRQEGESFVRRCARYFNGEYNNAGQYYELRDRFNRSRSLRQRAVLFVYLNRHGYNGLCRYNGKGGFNVPFGRYRRPYFPAREMLAFHARAQQAEFRSASFEDTLQQCRPGDVVYCDPPYVPLSDSANFTSYSAGGFDLDQQQRLVQLAEQAAAAGIPVLISNHLTPFTRKAYRNADVQDTFRVQRFISCKGRKRQAAQEVLAMFLPPRKG